MSCMGVIMHYLILLFVAFFINLNLSAATRITISNEDKIQVKSSFIGGKDREKIAVNNILKVCKKCDFQFGELKKIVHFIEKDFPKLISQKRYYVGTDLTGLTCALEYDVDSGLYFIHSNQMIGKGRVKIVTYTIQYSVENPKMVATTTIRSRGSLDAEIAVIKNLQHNDRILHIITTPKSDSEDGKTRRMITSFYEGGNLHDLELKKLTTREKISLAKDLMEALKEAHAKEFVHEDIHSANLLLEKNKNHALQNIRYRLVLADWGKAVAVSSTNDFYKRKDLYAAGVTLYGLFHNLQYPKHLYYKLNKFNAIFNENGLSKNPNKLLLGKLSPEISERLAILDQRFHAGSLKYQEKFERFILHMMHPQVVDSRDAAYWYSKLEELLL